MKENREFRQTIANFVKWSRNKIANFTSGGVKKIIFLNNCIEIIYEIRNKIANFVNGSRNKIGIFVERSGNKSRILSDLTQNRQIFRQQAAQKNLKFRQTIVGISDPEFRQSFIKKSRFSSVESRKRMQISSEDRGIKSRISSWSPA